MRVGFEFLTGNNRPAIGGSGSGEADAKTVHKTASRHAQIIALKFIQAEFAFHKRAYSTLRSITTELSPPLFAISIGAASRNGQPESKRGPFSKRALHVDLAAHPVDDVLDDGEAQARSTHLARTRLVDAIEAFEYSRQVP